MRYLVFSLLVLSAVSPSPICAVDLYGSSATAKSTAMSGAFSGKESGPTDALAQNPAALVSLAGPSLELSGLGVFAAGSYQNSTGIPGRLQSSSGLAPSAAFGIHVPNSRWSFAAGLLPTSMLSDSWQIADPVGIAGASYGAQLNKSQFTALQSTLGTGVRLTKRLSIGAAFGILYNRNTLQAPYIFQNNALTGLKTLLDLHTAGTGYNGTVGMIFEATRSLEFGLSYKTSTNVTTNGTASGNAARQFAVLQIPFQPSFHYAAQVINTFPQSASAYLKWKATPRLSLHTQADWVNWHSAFVTLPVSLTQGNNSDINGLLGTNTLQDSIPLHWRDQYTGRVATEYKMGEKAAVIAGFSHANSPVPASTLTPLTADIMRDGVSGGFTYNPGRYRFALAYQVNLPSTMAVGKSMLQSGEFDNTHTRLWLQTVALTTGFRW